MNAKALSDTYLDHWKVWLNKLLDLSEVDLLNITLSDGTEKNVDQSWVDSVQDIVEVDSLNIALANWTDENVKQSWADSVQEVVDVDFLSITLSKKTTEQVSKNVVDDWADEGSTESNEGINDVISWQEWQKVDDWWDGLGDGWQNSWVWVQELLKGKDKD